MEIDVKSCIGIDQWERLIILEHNKMKKSPTGLRPAFEAFLGNLEKDALTIEQPLGEGEYRVFVDYTMPHDKETLEREFSQDGVSLLFIGNYEWQLHPSCAKIDQTPGERIMLMKHFGHDTVSEPNIIEMGKLGYRPAIHLEAYAFAKANPKLQLQFHFVALGSSTMYEGGLCVAGLFSASHDRRIFGCYWRGTEWNSDDRFLFVRQ